MRILILSVSVGGGHVKTAEAIEDYIKINNPLAVTKLVDTIKYINPFLDKVVIGSYLKSLKLSPAIYGKIYDLAETEEGISNFSNKVNEMIIHKLVPLINEFNPDIIITTHPFSTEMISILKSKGKIHIPLMAVLTDYAPHRIWIHPNIDAYVVSNAEMASEMVTRGVPNEIIYPLGIPVKPEFMRVYPKELTLKSLNLENEKMTVLLMGGSLGLGKMSNLYLELQKITKDIQIIIITGNNKKLFSQLSEMSKLTTKETRIVGYTSEVNKFMQACDLLITKPGGLTITEALICNTPLALFSPIPGHEERNAEFLIKHNLAIKLDDCKHCFKAVDELLSSHERLNTMRENSKRFAKPNSGNDIFNLIFELTNR